VEGVVKTRAERPPRVIRLLRRPDRFGVGLLCITKDRKTHYYVFKEIPCEIGGRGFAVHRLGLANLYHVRVGKPRDCSCDCMGFLAHGRCKHLLGLQALIGHGLL
jgi:hypothetical protein